MHLSNETKEYLKCQRILSPVEFQEKPLFNYIGYIRYLNLTRLEQLLFRIRNVEEYKISNIIDEILELFINRNTKVTHLYIPSDFNHQIHLIPGAEHCFSGLKFLYCSTDDTNQNLLEGLSKISRLIRKMELFVLTSNFSGIIKLIESQKHLNEVWFYCQNKSIRESLEESLNCRTEIVKHVKLFFN
ncbi:20932_t:CDS:1 [Rhizophagus irregularis]|nr:20932_t:CDS:1 [Rhizophagus irregularis]